MFEEVAQLSRATEEGYVKLGCYRNMYLIMRSVPVRIYWRGEKSKHTIGMILQQQIASSTIIIFMKNWEGRRALGARTVVAWFPGPSNPQRL